MAKKDLPIEISSSSDSESCSEQLKVDYARMKVVYIPDTDEEPESEIETNDSDELACDAQFVIPTQVPVSLLAPRAQSTDFHVECESDTIVVDHDADGEADDEADDEEDEDVPMFRDVTSRKPRHCVSSRLVAEEDLADGKSWVWKRSKLRGKKLAVVVHCSEISLKPVRNQSIKLAMRVWPTCNDAVRRSIPRQADYESSTGTVSLGQSSSFSSPISVLMDDNSGGPGSSDGPVHRKGKKLTGTAKRARSDSNDSEFQPKPPAAKKPKTTATKSQPKKTKTLIPSRRREPPKPHPIGHDVEFDYDLARDESMDEDFDVDDDDDQTSVSDDEVESETHGCGNSTDSDVPHGAKKNTKAKVGSQGHKKTGFAESGINGTKRPIYKIRDIVKNLTETFLRKDDVVGLESCCRYLAGASINVGTFCSGTEAPILALKMIKQALSQIDHSLVLEFDHLFSAEIVPFKQHYIEANFSPPILFSDITEITEELPGGETVKTMTTAYGGRVPVPRGVDMVIAGFSCVDFSTLNSNKKVLEDKGESGDTFFAMREYAKTHRPYIIILENVQGAPWENAKSSDPKGKNPQKGLDLLMGEVGYATRFILLDTKDYYLPQTRQRGYMICVDKLAYIEGSPNPSDYYIKWEQNPFATSPELKGDLKKWVNLMKDSTYPASVPAELLLLRSDDPGLEALSSMDTTPGATASGTKRLPAWDTCKIGYNDYRESERLGKKREMTEWANGGAYTPEDYWKRTTKGLGERVLDTIEVAHLRNLKRGLDDRYAYRTLELSQNVYRVTDTSKFGIVGCLTPSGMPWLTPRGGRITGHEALILQGLPLEDLELNMLSQHDLQDLAGNAMSSTAVGAAVASALCVFYSRMKVHSRPQKSKPEVLAPNLVGRDALIETIKSSTEHSPLSLEMALAGAGRTRRLCPCEGRVHKKNTAFQKCVTCGHTTCMTCGIKPRHNYDRIPDSVIKKRQSPSSFEDILKHALPMSILFNANFEELNNHLASYDKFDSVHSAGVDEKFSDVVRLALTSEVYLREMRRDVHWEITYDSPKARLTLMISNEKVEWRLYANVDDKGLDTPQGKYFRRYPIAKMSPGPNNITVGLWKLWLSDVRAFKAALSWSGTLIKNFSAQRGLPDMETEYVYSICDVSILGVKGQPLEQDKLESEMAKYFERDVRGQYVLSQECAQPHNTLHARRCTPGEKSLMFYLEQHLRTGNPDPSSGNHYFVFTEETRRLEKLEHRTVIANFEKTWRAPIVKVKTEEDPVEDYKKFHHLRDRENVQYINHLPEAREVYPEEIEILVDGRWIQMHEFSMNSEASTRLSFQVLSPDLISAASATLSCMSPSQAVISFKAPLLSKLTHNWIQDKWINITRSNESDFTSDFLWALMPGCVIKGFRRNDNHWHAITCPSGRCEGCAPAPPSLQWSVNQKGKAVPSEVPSEALQYEKCMKSRPSPLVAKALIGQDGNVSIEIGVNYHTLIHRALAILPLLPNSESVKTVTEWRLVTDDVTYPNASLDDLQLQDNKSHTNKIDTPLLLISLRPEQERALHWAVERDVGDCPFVEQEIVEARLTALNYRLEGKAFREVKRRGGLMFFDVGFGKTAITLALTQHQLQGDIKAANDLMQSNHPLQGKIPLKATLIVVPDHLPQQWKNEVGKFVSKSNDAVLVIANYHDLKKTKVQQFKQAELIIVSWTIFEKPSYHEALAGLAGLVERDDKASLRAKSKWYKRALLHVSETVKQLHEDGVTPNEVLENLDRRYEEDDLASSAKVVTVPTKRQRGMQYIKGKQAKSKTALSSKAKPTTTSTTKKVKAPKVAVNRKRSTSFFKLNNINNINQMTCPLLEMFSFSRLVIDEFTYLLREPIPLLVVNNLSAPSRFILSGTPSLLGFPSVKQMATMLNIHLGIDDYSSMKTDIFKVATKDMTASEQFLTYKPAESTAWYVSRQEVAQRFLHTFARKDAADISNIGCIQHYHLVDLDPAHRAIYLELQQRVSTCTIENLRISLVESDSERLIREIILDGGDDLKKSLLLRASHLNLTGDDGGDIVDNEDDVCEDEDELFVGTGLATTDSEAKPRKRQLKRRQHLDSENELESKSPNVEISINSMIRTRTRQYQQLLTDIEWFLKEAVWLQNNTDSKDCNNFKKWLSKVSQPLKFLDEETRKDIIILIEGANLIYNENDWKYFYCKRAKNEKSLVASKSQIARKIGEYPDSRYLPNYPKGQNVNSNTSHLTKVAANLRTTTVKLSKLCEVTAGHNRSLRFIKAIRAVQTGLAGCSICSLEIPDAEAVTILGACGHVLCQKCSAHLTDGDYCPIQGCDAVIRDLQRFNGHEMTTGKRDTATVDGYKIDDITALVEKIINDGDKVLIFAQFTHLIKKLKDSLHQKTHPRTGQKLEFMDLTESAAKADLLSKFQDPSCTFSGMLLDPTAASASGANLTTVNHIIFVNPLHTVGTGAQEAWVSMMHQSIGRARRYGQMKRVYVHHFLAVNTIDIDMLQHRTGKIVRRVEGEPCMGELVDRDEGVVSQLHSRIVKLNYPGASMTD